MPAHAWRTLPLLQRPGWVAALGRELPGPLAGNSGFRADPPGAPTLLQLSALTRLSALRLASGNWEADGYDVLEQLPALRHLVFHSTLRLPDCLGELTQVQDLVSVPWGSSGRTQGAAACWSSVFGCSGRGRQHCR